MQSSSNIQDVFSYLTDDFVLLQGPIQDHPCFLIFFNPEQSLSLALAFTCFIECPSIWVYLVINVKFCIFGKKPSAVKVCSSQCILPVAHDTNLSHY